MTDFQNLNKALKRPVWGRESSGQLLRHVEPTAHFFACFDVISGFHQVRVDEASSKLLNITTQKGNYRYNVFGQGLCSSQDFFNLITDGTTKIDEEFQVLKNVDDFCVYSDTLEGLEEQIDKLIQMCRKINLKLSPSKFSLSNAVKFGGTVISSQKIKNNHIIFLDPPDSRILAVTEMPTPRTKKDLQTLFGMIANLRDWFPSVQLNTEILRAGCAH